MKKVIILSLVLIAAYFTSCKKEDTPAKINKTDVLIKTPWEINQAIFSPFTIYIKGGKENAYDASKVSLTFKKDGTITATDLNGNALAGKWSFNADETKITLPPGLPFSEVVVDQLTETNLDVNVPTFEYPVLGTVVKGKLIVKMTPKK